MLLGRERGEVKTRGCCSARRRSSAASEAAKRIQRSVPRELRRGRKNMPPPNQQRPPPPPYSGAPHVAANQQGGSGGHQRPPPAYGSPGAITLARHQNSTSGIEASMSRVKVSNVQDARVMMELQKELVLDDSTRSFAKKKPLLRMHDARPPMPRPVSPVAIVPFAPLSIPPSLLTLIPPRTPHSGVSTPCCCHWSTAATGPEGRPLT